MPLLFFLIGIVGVALLAVSVINMIQQRERKRRILRHTLRVRAETLEDTLSGLLHTIANNQIAKHINDEIVVVLNQLAALEKKNPEHILASIKTVEQRGADIDRPKSRQKNQYMKNSDLEIAQTHLHLNRALILLRHKHSEGRLTNEEVQLFNNDLLWAQLMVGAISFVGQGYKASERGDFFNAQAFYKKAQHVLIDSNHPDARRMRLIKELGEIISGARDKLSDELIN